jgi:pimeloyl-ACP methyl ester carboxylesterase
MPPNTTQTQIDGQLLHIEIHQPPTVTDSGLRPLLLLHGWGQNAAAMRSLAEGLAALGHSVHALDLPGFGHSPIPPDSWGVADYARCVAGYMSQVGLAPANIVGHSFGGRLGIVLAADHPSVVNKLVLAGSAGVLNPPTARDALVKLGKAAFKLPGLSLLQGQAKAIATAQFGSDDLKAAGPLEAIFRKVVVEDLLPRAARIAAPTLLMWGTADTATPLWQGQALAEAIADSGLVTYAGATHFAYLERLPDFIRVIDTFCKG